MGIGWGGSFFVSKQFYMIKKKMLLSRKHTINSSDRINRVLCVTRFLSFIIRVIPVLVVRHDHHDRQLRLRHKTFSISNSFWFFFPLSFDGVPVLLIVFFCFSVVSLSPTLPPLASHSVWAKGMIKKTKKKYDRRSTYKRHDCVDLPQFYHC